MRSCYRDGTREHPSKEDEFLNRRKLEETCTQELRQGTIPESRRTAASVCKKWFNIRNYLWALPIDSLRDEGKAC